jgi:hypothetical protein
MKWDVTWSGIHLVTDGLTVVTWRVFHFYFGVVGGNLIGGPFLRCTYWVARVGLGKIGQIRMHCLSVSWKNLLVVVEFPGKPGLFRNQDAEILLRLKNPPESQVTALSYASEKSRNNVGDMWL